MQVSNDVVEYVRNDINTQHRDGVWFIHGSMVSCPNGQKGMKNAQSVTIFNMSISSNE